MHIQKIKLLTIIAILSAAIALFVVLGAGSATGLFSLKQDTINVGVVTSATGAVSYQGGQEIKGLELARDEINSTGGINGKQLNLIIEDSKTNPAEGVNATNKLVSVDKVKFIIADPFNAVTQVMVPITNNNKIILISPGTTLDELSKDDYFFRTIPTTQKFAEKLAEYAYNDLNVRRAALFAREVSFDQEHATDFQKDFEQLGGIITIKETALSTQQDFRTSLTKIKATNPELVSDFFSAGAMLGEPLKEAKELGMNNYWIATEGAENAGIVKQYPDESNGLIYAYPYDLSSKEMKVSDFASKFEARYNESPDAIAAQSYDALMLIADTIKHAGENTTKAKAYLPTIKNYAGASGTMSFDANGDADKEIIIKQIQNGKFAKVK